MDLIPGQSVKQLRKDKFIWCYRRALRIPWTGKRTNKYVLEQIGNVPENWLQNTIMRQKLKFFGHIKTHETFMKA